MSAGTILSNNPAGLALKTQSEANNNLYVATGNESDSLNCNCAAFLDPFPNQITWRYVDFLHSEILQYVRDIIARRSAELFQIMCFITTQKWFQFFKSQFSYVSFAMALNMWFPIQFTRISLMIFFAIAGRCPTCSIIAASAILNWIHANSLEFMPKAKSMKKD